MSGSEKSTPDNSKHRLVAINLSCQRGERKLFDELNLTVACGACLHVIGANGSGKTSLLRMLCGISRIELGEVKWNQKSISGNQNYFSQMAYVGHKDGLKNELSAAENLEFYQRLNAVNDQRQADQVLARLGILDCADLATFQLSFGQRKRLALARLLLVHSPLWVLDEPFTGIDQEGRELIEQLCVEHLTKSGMIILTNHQSLQSGPLGAFLQELSL